MPSVNNGNNDSLIVKGVECAENNVRAEKSSPPEVFRGFVSIPRVLIQRIDIRPYLHANSKPPDKRKRMNTSLLDITNSCTAKFRKCFVKVARDDLEKLKQSIILENIMFISCRICKKNYADEKKLRKHQESKHMLVYEKKSQKRVSFAEKVIVHEVKEYHKCRKCTKIFEDYIGLKDHMKKEHRKRRCYICHYCSKSFMDRSIFKVHIKLHCDNCGLLFPNKVKYLEHRKNVCHSLKRYHCRTCRSIFYHFMDLKDHSYDHFTLLYICDICKDQLSSKCAVSHHISFLHSKNRPSLYTSRKLGRENLYICNFCDLSTVEKEVIEEHVSVLPDLSNRVVTDYHDYYFCEQCLKKFHSEQDLLQHKWTHYLKTNEGEINKTTTETETMQIPPLIKEVETETKMKKVQKVFNANDVIPDYMLPKVVLKKLPDLLSNESIEDVIEVETPAQSNDFSFDENHKNYSRPLVKKPTTFLDMNKLINEEYSGVILTSLNKPIVDPKSKKTLLSKHKCQKCLRYFSSGFTLRRHDKTVHQKETPAYYKCSICEESFAWESLLYTHRCIRTHPETLYHDLRPEIHFDNADIDMTNIDDDYSDCVDFEIPAPIVELTEYDNLYIPNDFDGNNDNHQASDSVSIIPIITSNSHKIPNVAASNVHNVAASNIHNVAPSNIHNVAVSNIPNVCNVANRNVTNVIGANCVSNIGSGVAMIGNGIGVVGNGVNIIGNGVSSIPNNVVSDKVRNLGYKIVMQEVPIEF